MRRQAIPVVEPLEQVARSGGLLRDLLVTARPQQWLKNLLLYAAFVFSAGTAWGWRDLETWAPMLLTATAAFALFTVAAAGGYFINDVLNAERDRAHPRKPESTDGLGCAGCRARNGRFGGCGSGWWRWQGATVAVRACGQEETAMGRRSQACWRQAVERSARPSGVRSGAGSPAAGRGRR